MKKNVLFFGIVIAICLSINAINGLCADYRGKLPPSDPALAVMLNYYLSSLTASGQASGKYNVRIVGKTKDSAENYYFYYYQDAYVPRLSVIKIVHLDNDLWVISGPNGDQVMQSR